MAQNRFQINSDVGDSLWIEINGKKYCLNSNFSQHRTNYPLFDTLSLISEGSNFDNLILCNFKPNSSYSISVACCGSLDVIPSSKLENDSLNIWNYEENYSKIQQTLMDRPFISMRIASEVEDTIYGWYADMACFPKFKRLRIEKWEYGVPQKCFFWNNISPFFFFKSSSNYRDDIMENGVIEDIYPMYSNDETIEILAEINLRLFDNERFILTYFPMTKSVILEYDY